MLFLHLVLLLAGCSGHLYTISCWFSHETVFADEGSQGWRLKHPHWARIVYSWADKRRDRVPEVQKIELLIKDKRLSGARINFDLGFLETLSEQKKGYPSLFYLFNFLKKKDSFTYKGKIFFSCSETIFIIIVIFIIN